MNALGRVAVVLSFAGSVLSAFTAAAQSYPTKPVRLVVPFAPGGGVDVTARILAQALTQRVGQSFIVENRAGASGAIGTEFVAKSTPDGYTLLVGSQTTQSVVPAIHNVGYDGARDFIGITEIAKSPLLIVVNPSLPVKTVADLIELAKTRPGQLTFGAALGASPHMAGELFKRMAKVDMLFVPYKGEGPAITDATSGQISLVFSNLPVGLPQARGGRLRGIAVTSPQRASTAPEFPTVAESGLPGFEAATWFGLFAPASTAQDIIVKLNAEVVGVLNMPEIRDRMTQQGFDVTANTPNEFQDFLKKDLPRWAKIAKESGVRLQ